MGLQIKNQFFMRGVPLFLKRYYIGKKFFQKKTDAKKDYLYTNKLKKLWQLI